jgi:hypothetical protein
VLFIEFNLAFGSLSTINETSDSTGAVRVLGTVVIVVVDDVTVFLK